MITDAQVHIWEPETPHRPWIKGGREFAHGDQLTADGLVAKMTGAGVDQAVLVPPSWEGDRNDVCVAAAQRYPDRFRVMCRITLADEASKGTLAEVTRQPGVLGVRVAFGKQPAFTWLTDGSADWVWPEALEQDIPLMVFAPGQLSEIRKVASRYPGLRLIIDHLGINTSLRDEAIDPVIDEVITMAEFDNVAVKASCLPSNVSEGYPFRSLHSRIRRVVEAFGPRRTFWGSDLSRLPCGYDEARRLFVDELTFLSPTDLEWIMGRGVREWLGWSDDPGT